MKLIVLIACLLFSSLTFAGIGDELVQGLQNHLRVEAFALSGRNTLTDQNNYIENKETKPSTGEMLPGLELALGFNYQITPSLLTVTKIRGAGDNSDGSTRRDQDLVSTAGNKIRLVEETNKYKYTETGVEQILGYRFEGPFFGNRAEYRPFISLGYANGSATMTKEIMTDRAHWALFSTHNRYTYKYDQEYDRRTAGAGFEMLLFQKLIVSLGVRYSLYRFKNVTTSVDYKGEAPEFTQNDIAPPQGFSEQKLSEGFLGIGYHF